MIRRTLILFATFLVIITVSVAADEAGFLDEPIVVALNLGDESNIGEEEPRSPEVELAVEENADSSSQESEDEQPPNFWDFAADQAQKSDNPDPVIIKGHPLARLTPLLRTNSADGHEDWRNPGRNDKNDKDKNLVDDSNLVHFIDGDADTAGESVEEEDTDTADDGMKVADQELARVPIPSAFQRPESASDMFHCVEISSLYFEAVANPSYVYFSDDRRNRMDFLIYEMSKQVPTFDMSRHLAVHWVYTSDDGEECEMPDPAFSGEFLATEAFACSQDKNFEIVTHPVANERVLSTSLQLDDEDLLNFLPGKFSLRLYFRCQQDFSDVNLLHAWTSKTAIPLGYTRPLKSWVSATSVEMTIAMIIMMIGLISGLAAVYLWKKMAPPASAGGFEYAALAEPIATKIPSKPSWV